MADLPCVAVAPISFAYSGSSFCVGPVHDVASCHTARKAKSRTTERTAARSASEKRMSAPFDREAGRIIFGLRWVEKFSHHGEGLRRCRGRREAGFAHRFGCICRKEDLARDLLIVDVVLDL